MIDTHCHLTYKGLGDRLDEVLANATAAGVDRMVTIGTQPDDAARTVDLIAPRPHLYAAVGLHPHYADRWHDRAEVMQALARLSQAPRVVALGEMGLDRHYPDPPLSEQRRVLAWQLELAAETKRPDGQPFPVIIHNRKATSDILAMLRDSGIAPGRFVFHCFTGDDTELDAILDFGAMVSFTGIVTFANSQALAHSAARVPLDRAMIETDAPYLTPAPHRKIKTNEPRYVAVVAAFLAAQRGMTTEPFVQAMDANAQRFFGLPPA